MEAFEYTGVWWLPGSESMVAGTIAFDGKEFPRLRLIGLLRPFEQIAPILPTVVRYELVLGVAGTKKITLYGSVQANFAISAPGIPTEELVVPLVILGEHVQSPADFQFTSVAMAYDGLVEWSGVTAITQRSDRAEDADAVVHTIRLESPEVATVTIADAEVSFRISWWTGGE